MKVCKSMWK